MVLQQIVIRDITRPRRKKVREEVHWLVNTLGFEHGRDLDHTAFRIVDALLAELSKEPAVSTERIAEQLHISAARVNHHIRNIAESGFVYRERKRIALRGGSVQAAVVQMRRDANRIFDELEAEAAIIDQALGLQRLNK